MAGNEMSFRSMLVGFDDDWNEWTPSYHKGYTGIPERGNYTFNVMGRDDFGNETNVASIRIFIDIPWYQTQLKYLIAIPFATLLFFGLVRFRTRKFERIRRKLEVIIKERTGDLLKKQENLEQVNKELNNTNRELDSFVYHTSHDLKAPLKSIIGLIKLSEKEKFSNENISLYLHMIENSVVKLEEFISSIIEYSMNAKGVLMSEKIDFEKIIGEVLEELKEFSHLKEINIRNTINLEKVFICDPVRIKIIINNLVTNAVKYHDLTKEDPFIDIIIRQENGWVYMDVIDNGLGIHEDYQDKVFDMFYRASGKSWGSGLGLYIIKETVKNLRGTISMKSTFGSGTSFQILLPEN
jgi:signal transduction histidine kinase